MPVGWGFQFGITTERWCRLGDIEDSWCQAPFVCTATVHRCTFYVLEALDSIPACAFSENDSAISLLILTIALFHLVKWIGEVHCAGFRAGLLGATVPERSRCRRRMLLEPLPRLALLLVRAARVSSLLQIPLPTRCGIIRSKLRMSVSKKRYHELTPDEVHLRSKQARLDDRDDQGTSTSFPFQS